MNEWLDNFQMMGVKLNEGEKTLMRMAMKKERERIIKLIDTDFWHHRIWGNDKPTCLPDCAMCKLLIEIKGNSNETT